MLSAYRAHVAGSPPSAGRRVRRSCLARPEHPCSVTEGGEVVSFTRSKRRRGSRVSEPECAERVRAGLDGSRSPG